MPTFSNVGSGWGLDFVWPKLLGCPHRVGIVDRVAVTHTRPVGMGSSYSELRRQGVNPRSEMIALLQRYNCPSPSLKQVTGAIDVSGNRVPPESFAHREDLGLVQP